MRLEQIAIATITWVRSEREEETLRRALPRLTALGAPVTAADGGSNKRFLEFMRSLGIKVLRPRRKGLVPQVKTAIEAASKEFVLYTEPDKLPFFESGLCAFVRKARPASLTFAARDESSLKTFPRGQRTAEGAMNELTSLMAVVRGDCCYGPLLLNRDGVKAALESPDQLGWGWRFYTLGRLVSRDKPVKFVSGSFPCPREQRSEDAFEDRVYRLKQMRQNIEGLLLGLGLQA